MKGRPILLLVCTGVGEVVCSRYCDDVVLLSACPRKVTVSGLAVPKAVPPESKPILDPAFTLNRLHPDWLLCDTPNYFICFHILTHDQLHLQALPFEYQTPIKHDTKIILMASNMAAGSPSHFRNCRAGAACVQKSSVSGTQCDIGISLTDRV